MSASAQVTAPRLEIQRPGVSERWVHLGSTFHSNTVLTLEVATNLGVWRRLGTLHEGVFGYPDVATPDWPQRFFRLNAASRGANDDWKNQVLHLAEPFRSATGAQNVTWVKFAIVLEEPTRVYYQDSRKYLFHFDFATRRLPQFMGMDRAVFDTVSLHRAHQQVVLGAVLYPPAAGFSYPPVAEIAEYGVQFVGLDPYTPEEISRWFELVRATVHATNPAKAYYMPTFEQADVARTHAEAFAALGIPVASVERWITVNSCYSAGWALGRLKYFEAGDVGAAFGEGRLQPGDILLTDGVPADTPLVAGILTLVPSTPNSHTAILCQSFGIPFCHLADSDERVRVQGLVGHKVVVRATVDAGVAQIRVLDVEGQLDAAFEAELLALKTPEPIDLLPRQSYGAIWASTDTLVPADIRYFGGKAAHYGLLRRWIPDHCPLAIAFSFDLWEAFLDQALPGGGTLRGRIASRLAPYTNYPPDIVSLKTDLAAIRDLFTQTARFSTPQQQAITNALSGRFDPLRKIRFRSSANVEDTEHFSGAGLYDSYSGCLMDDLDGNSSGPCQCDPTESKERGVFRAMQKVYASFYNDDAYLERLRHRVDENQVAMGVLAHHSFPDEEELANGVATATFEFTGYSTNVTGNLVTQLGAVSVTNPDGLSVPEIVSASRYPSHTTLALNQYSSLVPLGQPVMDWPADYHGFMDLFAAVGCGFRQVYPAKNGFTLDFEYKKDLNLGWVVKQVREVPKSGATNSVTAFLVDEPVAYSVLQAEGANVFASHRLKSLWALRTANLRMTAANLVHGIYTQGSCEYVENGTLQMLAGPLDTWPHASSSSSGTVNSWTTGSGAQQRAWRLETGLTTRVSGAEPPILTQAEFPKQITVTYATPVPTISDSGLPDKVTRETASLEVRPVLGLGAVFQERRLVKANVLTIQTSFYWPKQPEGILIYTAPLLRFVETRISGLTADPIVLTGGYSQTYGPGHHNFSEEFIFEPRLEPGLPPAILAELEAANIQSIYARWQIGGDTTFYILGLDQKLRAL